MKNFLNNLFRKNYSPNEESVLDVDIEEDSKYGDIENNTNENNYKKNERILKFNDYEYLFDNLPLEAKKLIMGLKTADAQTKMYEDNIKLIAVGKNKMIEDLKMILDKIKPIKD